jgi:2-desacetyl-2-hydroxyethyl bacteriochlorophyllide A dehydrogenase
MKVLVCLAPGKFEYQEKTIPSISDRETLLRIKRIGICGTDLHAYEGTQPFFNYPRILGHELAAEIVETDSKEFEVGENVTIIPYFNCGNCIACGNNKPNCCVNIKVCGVHIDGGMTEFLQVPTYSLVKSLGLGLDELALVEPLAIGAHGVSRANVQKGEFVLIIGAGPIGLGTMELAKIAGGKVIAMDVNEDRLKFCKENLKIHHLINPLTENVTERLSEITGNNMPTVIIDATGNLKAINNAFQYLAHGGRYVLIGLQKGDIVFNHPDFHKKESTLMSSRNATRADFDHVIKSMQEGLINPSTYITHRVQFDDVSENFESWLNPANGVIKAMVSL